MNALEKREGPCVVLAGAGTGKTYTIIEKVKKLVLDGVYDSKEIVCITFSNEAANSLKARLQKELQRDVKVQTFHAFSADLLREHGDKIGLKQDFGILTPDEAKVILNRNLGQQVFYCHKYISTIGIAKDLGVSLNDVKEYLDKKRGDSKRLDSLRFELQTLHLSKNLKRKRELVGEIKDLEALEALRKFSKVWEAYEKLKGKHNYLDYSDLNAYALILLRKHEEIIDDYKYVIVDEFQDTNKTQLDFLEKLAGHGNIMVVGDMNQSIYRFRGAYKKNFQDFKKSFNIEEGGIFALDKSYRSPNSVLTLAYQLIRENYEDKRDCFLVENFENRPGEKVQVYEMENGYEEARKVVELIDLEMKKGVPAEEICVMFRTHQQGRVLRRVLDSEGIEYSSVSKKSLLEYDEVKTAMDYLVILDALERKKKGKEQAWWDLVYRSGFTEKDLVVIGKFMKEKKGEDCLSEIMINGLLGLNLTDKGKLAGKVLLERISKLSCLKVEKVSDLITEIYRLASLLESLDKNKLVNMNKFRELADGHASLYGKTLESFVNYLETLRTLGIEIESSNAREKGVQLMTIHATKGLEYKTVILTNMAQKRFPIEQYNRKSLIPLELFPEFHHLKNMSEAEKEIYLRNYLEEQDLLEERRLCYVAFTRAKDRLIVTYAKEYAGKKFWPSRFLQDLRYKENELVGFFQDLGKDYQPKEVEVKRAFDISKALRTGEFESVDLKKRKDDLVFSPSGMLLFNECQKKYEYKYVYQMPEERPVSWDAIQLGSFVHLVLEEGVNSKFKTEKEFIDNARELHLQEDWESVDLQEAERMIRVFFERNKSKISDKSVTEQHLELEMEGYRFRGFADRIDFSENGLEIIDYKTGRSIVQPRHRDWQLGYYALAAARLGEVRKLTLDMLRHEKPLEFEIDGNGLAKSVNGRMEFSIPEIKEELISTAKAITDAYQLGFKACSVDKNCEFCNEYVYGL